MTNELSYQSLMRRKRKIAMAGFGDLLVFAVMALGGVLLFNFWENFADWAKVVLLMVWGATFFFWPVIAAAIDSDTE